MTSPIRIVSLVLLLAAHGATSPPHAPAQPIAKASFLAEGSWELPSTGAGALERPRSVAWATGDRIHVADERGTVAVFDAAGSLLRTYGDGSLKKVASLAVDAAGRAYVLDVDQKSVLVFDEDGNVIHRVGSGGGSAGRLDEPADVAVDAGSRVYVLDRGRRGVQVFALDGTFLHDIALPLDVKNPCALGVATSGAVFVADKDAPGSLVRLPNLIEALALAGGPPPSAERMQLRSADVREPVAVVATPTGTVAVGDRESGVLWCADATGEPAVGSDDRLYGGKGSGRGSFRRLADMTLAGTDEMVLLDSEVRKIERIRLVLEENRTTQEALDYPVLIQSVEAGLEGSILATASRAGGTEWYAVADREGRGLRVVEARMAERTGVFGERIRVPEAMSGAVIHDLAPVVERVGGVAVNDTLLVATEPRRNRFHVVDLRTDAVIGAFGHEYSDDRRLRGPEGVALFPDGRIAVADRGNDRIAVFSADVATLLGTYALPKAKGVTISPDGRMFAWDEDGLQAGEISLTGGALAPLPPSVVGAGVAALTVDGAGNLYALRRESGRIAILDAALDRVLARVGSEEGLEKGDHLTVDADGNIYATSLERGETSVVRWGVEVPPVASLTAAWEPDAAILRWSEVPGSFVTGYQVEGASSADGPWSRVAVTERTEADVRDPAITRYRVSSRTISGAVGAPSPVVPVLHLAAADALRAGRWDEARRRALEALGTVEGGAASVSAAVTEALAWEGFVAAHELEDCADVLAWQERLGGSIPAGAGFDHARRLADALRKQNDIGAATTRALEALDLAAAAPATAPREQVAALRETVFADGAGLGLWDRVATVGEDMLRDAPERATDVPFVEALTIAHLKAGSAGRATELLDRLLAAGGSEAPSRSLLVLSLMAAAAREDFARAEELAATLGDSIPRALWVDYEETMARVWLRTGKLAEARAEILSLLGETGEPGAVADPAVRSTVLSVFGGSVEAGQTPDARAMLDSIVSVMPEGLAEVRSELLSATDSVEAIADTRAKLGEGIGYFRDALFRDALRFFQAADARTDLDVDQRLIVKEILSAVFYSLGRTDDADEIFRGLFAVDPDFHLDVHLEKVNRLYGLTIFTEEMLVRFRDLGPIM